MNVLCITPFFSRTGSEINLLNLINAQSNNVNFTVYSSFSKGSLCSELDKNVNYYSHTNSLFNRISNKVLEIFSSSIYELQLNRILKKHKIDVIYVNTIINSHIIPFLRKTKIPFVIHVHELESFYEIVSKDNFNFIVNQSKGVIVCSKQLEEKFAAISSNKVYYLPETFNSRNTNLLDNSQSKFDKFTWICSGQKSYRKGFDLFPKIAKLLPEDDFIWLGGSANTGLDFMVEETIKSENLKNCKILGEQKDEYYSYFNKAHGFLLLSREDPYPLVMIEAANFKLPVVGFKSGGFVEFCEMFSNTKCVEVGDLSDLVIKMKEVKGSHNLNFSTYPDLVKSYDSKIVSESFIEILKSVVFQKK